MARDIPVGNGDLLITFDRYYRVRDIYFPYVGRYNHAEGHVQRFGVWADGEFRWIEDSSWDRKLRYRHGARPDSQAERAGRHVWTRPT
jgi:GH15 family glucan-1,4-alpha-glucosidase